METSPGRPPRPTPRRSAPRPGTDRSDANAGGDPDGPGDPPEPDTPRRRRSILLALGVVAAASAAALVAGLLSWAPQPADSARPLTATEAERLAAMRVTNYRDVRSGVRATIGAGAGRTELVGWVDWARPLVYLDVGGPGAGGDRGLLQATPSTVVLRPDPAVVPTAARPPLVPPADRWRLRELPSGRGLAPVLQLLLALGADRWEPSTAMITQARWLGRDTAGGTPVDILQAPLLSPVPSADRAGASAPAEPIRSARLWLDRDARLHRVQGRLPDDSPVTVELERSDRPTLRPVDALGGRPGLPRALTEAEADRLTRLPARLHAAGGAALTLTAPLGPAVNLRAAGWLSWADPSAYLTVSEVATPGSRTLLRYRAGRLSRAEVSAGAGAGAETPARPPLPPPAHAAWSPVTRVTDDLGRLVEAGVWAGGTPVAARAAVVLRGDRVADRTVDVVELRDHGVELRYWIDRGGLLRRLELRTGRGVWAQLDLVPGPVPALPRLP